MPEPRLVLASVSPRRAELLRTLGLPFDIRPVDIDEAAVVREASGEPPDLVVHLAQAKARAVQPQGDEVILAADTIVWLNGRILGKPRDIDEARSMLRELRGRDHFVSTAMAVRYSADLETDLTTARVVMRWYGEQEIERYIDRGEPFDKAGAYAIQDREFTPVVSLHGCYCAVMGLPLYRTVGLLRAPGLNPLPPSLPQCGVCPDRP